MDQYIAFITEKLEDFAWDHNLLFKHYVDKEQTTYTFTLQDQKQTWKYRGGISLYHISMYMGGAGDYMKRVINDVNNKIASYVLKGA